MTSGGEMTALGARHVMSNSNSRPATPINLFAIAGEKRYSCLSPSATMPRVNGALVLHSICTMRFLSHGRPRSIPPLSH